MLHFEACRSADDCAGATPPWRSSCSCRPAAGQQRAARAGRRAGRPTACDPVCALRRRLADRGPRPLSRLQLTDPRVHALTPGVPRNRRSCAHRGRLKRRGHRLDTEPLALVVTVGAGRPRRGRDMEDAHARREGRFGRGEASDASGNAQPLRLAELERERAALAMFAGVAAHELTVPLIAAETHARLLEEQLAASVDGFSSADLEELFRSLSRMRLLVATLLHDARCAGQPLERGPVSLQRLVDAGAELLARDVQARRARIVTGDLPVVDADEVLLGGVVNNLLLNALRYGPLSGG